MEYEGYCVKCRKKVIIKGGGVVIWKTRNSERRAWQGLCPNCGTKVSRVLGKA